MHLMSKVDLPTIPGMQTARRQPNRSADVILPEDLQQVTKKAGEALQKWRGLNSWPEKKIRSKQQAQQEASCQLLVPRGSHFKIL